MPRHATAHTIAGVPVLLATPSEATTPAPVVLWAHGFRADALAHAGELERVADAGFIAIGLDAVGHGARRDGQLEDRLSRSADGALPVVLDLVRQTVLELPALIDALVAHHAADRARISLVGISMGAFLGYHAIAQGVPLRAAVALLGDPVWAGHGSPHRQLSAFANVALLSITAEHDVSVPPAPARRFHDLLRETFDTSRHRHHELRGAGHLTSAAEWAEAMDVTMDWLHRYGR